MKYQHFAIEEREKIQELLWQKASIRTIAKTLGRNPSSVSREIKRNAPPIIHGRYTPRLAHERAISHRQRRGREERLKNEELRNYAVCQLKLGWSPEQVAATSQNAVGTGISYVYAQVYREGHGYLKPGKEDLRPYLARHRKRRMKKRLRKSYRIQKGPLPTIDERPKEVEKRQDVGHWEDDCIVSRASLDRLKTINERVSGIVFITKIKDGTIEETNRAVSKQLDVIPARLRKTLTRDRGSENMGYEALKKELGIRCFFAHAYHSWERGSNENLNGLIRRFFPKKTDFHTTADEEIQRIE